MRLRKQAGLGKQLQRSVIAAGKRRDLREMCGPERTFRGSYLSAMTFVGFLHDGERRERLPELVRGFQKRKSTDFEPFLGLLDSDWEQLTADWIAYCERTWGARGSLDRPSEDQ